jgi:hypothetical protein
MGPSLGSQSIIFLGCVKLASFRMANSLTVVG